MIRLFLSYASEDLSFAARLYRQLNSYPGIDVWFDKESLLAGQDWEAEVRNAIREARYFILLISKNSNKKGYYQKEIRLALQILDEYPESEIYMIPARIDDAKPPFDRLNSLQHVDLFPVWEHGVEKIFTSIRAHSRIPNSIQVRKVRFTSHQARFERSPRMFYFINLTNIGDQPIEVTHIWYEDSLTHISVNPKSRPLPVRLEVNQSWATWIHMDVLPEISRHNAFGKFQLRLSTGEIISSIKEDNVPPRGSVPGGNIDIADI